DVVARAAWQTAYRALANDAVALDVAVFDRDGRLVGRCLGADHSPLPRNRR
ncbi:MAG: cobalt-precorrin-5B (C(1))-methyltransferase, partial [Bradyrhizobium sp.]|nr:cobalt-precorrin-5B (C(1))-methyltransferase [Bradyrhizobium sp.]